MTIRELKEILASFDDNAIVVIKPSNTRYVESVNEYGIKTRDITAFYGDDFNAVVISTGEQLGSI